MDDTTRYDGPQPPSGDSVWRCNSCQQQVREGLRLCPFCGQRISFRGRPQKKWYYSRYGVAISLATLGPFALPMVWSNPRYTRLTKIALTILTIVLTVLLIYIVIFACTRLVEQFRQLTIPY